MIQRIHHSSSLIFGQSKQEHDKHSCMEMQHLYDAVMQNDVIALAPRLHYVYSESNQGEKAFLAAQYYGKCQICGKQIFRSNGKPYFEACNILPTNAIPDRYKHSISEGWNSLCLCPNCAAEFKYGKKNLSELISMIQDYHVKENDENLITCRIEMQGEQRTIKYTGKHFLALQKAIGFYSNGAE